MMIMDAHRSSGGACFDQRARLVGVPWRKTRNRHSTLNITTTNSRMISHAVVKRNSLLTERRRMLWSESEAGRCPVAIASVDSPVESSVSMERSTDSADGFKSSVPGG